MSWRYFVTFVRSTAHVNKIVCFERTVSLMQKRVKSQTLFFAVTFRPDDIQLSVQLGGGKGVVYPALNQSQLEAHQLTASSKSSP